MSNDQNIALAVKDVSKSYGDQKVLKGINVEVKDKEFLILLGPSGCGKTTLLRIIAGLLTLNSGSVILKGRDITHTPAYHRDIGMVFQNYALFPHMNVFQNIAFGLRMRGLSKEEIEQRIRSILKLVHLEGMGNRSVKQLSGGQQQRVALARALVLKPSLLLLDEPLSNLDAKLRAAVRVEIAQIQRELGLTAILVTHDQTEAMTMGDRIILMQDGIIQQSASPTDIYEKPENVFVASFIGSPQINLFNGAVRGGVFQFEEINHALPVEKISSLACADIRNGKIPEGRYVLGVRPEGFTIEKCGAGEPIIEGKIIFIENLGADYYLHVRTGEKTVIVRNPPQGGSDFAVGDAVGLCFRPGSVHVFDAESQARLKL
jgi:ABC-type sugar transport system ATPase subunit